ncbi:hypothetical protein DKX38_001386 [Salix brachista]|uniref:Uncharacterized protein n=1 Tax=Salix brachista TaxID=2182728 RepID=A0A5N5P3K0_9ROSI|nr:hypothetical protein DKX38_001386 [Salix brachista]
MRQARIWSVDLEKSSVVTIEVSELNGSDLYTVLLVEDIFVMDCVKDAEEGQTLILCGEIVLAQKVMYEKFGDDFPAHLVTKCFTSAHCLDLKI